MTLTTRDVVLRLRKKLVDTEWPYFCRAYLYLPYDVLIANNRPTNSLHMVTYTHMIRWLARQDPQHAAMSMKNMFQQLSKDQVDEKMAPLATVEQVISDKHIFTFNTLCHLVNHSTDGTLQQLNDMLAEEESLLLCTTDGEDKQDMMHYKVQYWINVWTYQTGNECLNIEDLVDRYITDLTDHSTLYQCPVSDALISYIAKHLPESTIYKVAKDIFKLTDAEFAYVTSLKSHAQVNYLILYQLVQDSKLTVEALRAVVVTAMDSGFPITINLDEENEKNFQGNNESVINCMLFDLASDLGDTFPSFLHCFFGKRYLDNSFYTSIGSAISGVQMLSKWRDVDGRHRTVAELLRCCKLMFVIEPRASLISEETIKDVMNDHYQGSHDRYTFDFMCAPYAVTDVQELQMKLKTFYVNKFSEFTPVPWVEEYKYDFDAAFIPLQLKYSEQSTCSFNNILSFSEDSIYAEAPHAILVEGEAGGGKTTMCQRIAYLWARDIKNIRLLDTFDFTFFIEAHLIRSSDKSLNQYIEREYGFPPNQVTKMLQQPNILVIFDGHDELGTNTTVLEEILDSKDRKTSTTLVTCRTKQISKAIRFDRSYLLSRIESKDIHNHMTAIHGPTKKIDFNTHPLGSILSTPLFLWYYIILGVDMFDKVDIGARSFVYSKIIESIMTRVATKTGFSRTDCHTAYSTLCKIASNCLLTNTITFKDDNLPWLSANIGLVKYESNISKSKAYKFNHQSIMEYLSSSYVMGLDENEQCKYLKRIGKEKETLRANPLFMYFLCGMSEVKSLSKHILELVAEIAMKSQKVEDNHASHEFILHCFAELSLTSGIKIPSRAWKHYVQNDIVLDMSQCSHFCIKGLHNLLQNSENDLYTLRTLTVRCFGDVLGIPATSVTQSVISLAEHNRLEVDVADVKLWSRLVKFYDNIELDDLTIQRCNAYLSSDHQIRTKALDIGDRCNILVGLQLLHTNVHSLESLSIRSQLQWEDRHIDQLNTYMKDMRITKMKSLVLQAVPPNVATTVIGACQQSLKTLELSTVKFVDDQPEKIASLFQSHLPFENSCDEVDGALNSVGLETLRLCFLRHKSIGCDAISQILPLQNKDYDTLSDLGVICCEAESITSLAKLLPKLKLRIFGFGCADGTTEDVQHEKDLWKAVLNSETIEHVYIYNDNDVDFNRSIGILQKIIKKNKSKNQTKRMHIVPSTHGETTPDNFKDYHYNSTNVKNDKGSIWKTFFDGIR